MKQLIEISDTSLGLEPFEVKEYYHHETARAVIFNAEGKISLLNVGKHNYHKLPGGGVENGETWQEAVLREAMEEVGAEIKLRDIEVGQSLEYRGQLELRQVSYCYLADLVGKTGELKREANEVENQQLPIWVTLEEAIDLIQSDQPDDYEGKFIVVRDLAFLEEAKKLTQPS